MGTKTKVNKITGLTTKQERACNLLASGISVVDVAKELDVPEQTLFLWQRQTTFSCYYNKRRSIIKDVAVQSLFGLVGEAVTAIRESLNSTNESVRLKAATYVINKLQDIDLGKTSIIEAVKEETTYCDWGGGSNYLHINEYKERLNELGVQEQDYQSSLS